MSIKERLSKGPMDRQRTILPGLEHKPYKEKVLEVGLSVHREAGVSNLLQELAEVIKPNFSDVKVCDPLVIVDGAVSMAVVWNSRDIPNRLYPIHQHTVHNKINVKAYPVTRDLVVQSSDESELLRHVDWSMDNQLLEDAIVRAYRDPLKVEGEPV